VATGVTETGDREILGIDVGDSEDEVFWRGFLRTSTNGGSPGSAWSSPTNTPAWSLP
jgi:transposase-like protein